MDRNVIRISRRELYDQVWSIPMWSLAKKYGRSDVGLSKICKKHDIPCPPRGYWAKVESHRKPKQIPLPRKDADEIIEIHPNPFHSSHSDPKERVTPKDPEERIIVAEELRNPHPLVKQSADILKTIQPDATGIIIPAKENCLDIRVSKKSLRRALLIMDALVKSLEKRGFEVRLSKQSTEVKILDTVLGITISEELVRERKEPKDSDLNGYYRFGHSRFEDHPIPSGILCLSIHSGVYFRGFIQQNWRDREKRKLEDSLNKFIQGLAKIAVLKKEHIQRKQQEERERIEQQKKWEEERRRAEAEKQKLERLMRNVENWYKSRQIREYISAVEEMASSGKYTFNMEGGVESWIKWAKEQADRFDPLFPLPRPRPSSKENVDDGPSKNSD